MRPFAVAILFSLGLGSATAGPSDVIRVKIKNAGTAIAVKNTGAWKCSAKAPSAWEAVQVSTARLGVKPNEKTIPWLSEAFSVFGYTTALPKENAARDAAMTVIELLRRDSLVAAKFSNDIAAEAFPAYRTHQLFWDVDRYVRNNTTPNSPDDPSALSGHERWLARAAARVSAARKVLAQTIDDRYVRMYAFAFAYDDGVALDIAQVGLCSSAGVTSLMPKLFAIGDQLHNARP